MHSVSVLKYDDLITFSTTTVPGRVLHSFNALLLFNIFLEDNLQSALAIP